MDGLTRAFGFGEVESAQYDSESFCERLGSALCGVVVGLFLVPGALVLIWWNEGRAVYTAKALEEGRAAYVDVGCDPLAANEGKLVHISCDLKDLPVWNDTEIWPDTRMGLKVRGTKMKRVVEMYQYVEHSRTKEGSGGSKKTCYYWDKQWRSTRATSYHTASCSGYSRPSLPPSFYINKREWSQSNVRAGGFNIPKDLADKISDSDTVPLRSNLFGNQRTGNPPNSVNYQNLMMDGNYATTSLSPVVGDMRMRWYHSSATKISVLAQQTGSSFKPWPSEYNDDYTVYLLDEGDKSAEDMIQSAESANKMIKWILRLVGFLVCWCGFHLIFAPFALIPTIVPCIGDCLSDIVGCLLCVATCLMATTLSFIDMAIAWIFYRPHIGIPLLIIGLAALGILIWWTQCHNKSKRKSRGSEGDYGEMGGQVPPAPQQPQQPQQPAYPADPSAYPTNPAYNPAYNPGYPEGGYPPAPGGGGGYPPAPGGEGGYPPAPGGGYPPAPGGGYPPAPGGQPSYPPPPVN